MSMGKNKRSPLAQMVSAAPMMDKMPEQSPEMTIKQAANGGYTVSMQGKEGYSSRKEHVYASLDKLLECVEAHFGKAEKSEAGEKKGEA